MSTDDPDEALREFKRRIFGDRTATVPRVFLYQLRRCIPPTAYAVGRTYPEHRMHHVCWLYGSVFGSMSCEGSNDDSDARIEGAILPLSELTLVRIGVDRQHYDPDLRRVTRWTRRATFSFGGKEMHLTADESPEGHGTDDMGDFIDRVLLALSAYGQTS